MQVLQVADVLLQLLNDSALLSRLLLPLPAAMHESLTGENERAHEAVMPLG